MDEWSYLLTLIKWLSVCKCVGACVCLWVVPQIHTLFIQWEEVFKSLGCWSLYISLCSQCQPPDLLSTSIWTVEVANVEKVSKHNVVKEQRGPNDKLLELQTKCDLVLCRWLGFIVYKLHHACSHAFTHTLSAPKLKSQSSDLRTVCHCVLLCQYQLISSLKGCIPSPACLPLQSWDHWAHKVCSG